MGRKSRKTTRKRVDITPIVIKGSGSNKIMQNRPKNNSKEVKSTPVKNEEIVTITTDIIMVSYVEGVTDLTMQRINNDIEDESKFINIDINEFRSSVYAITGIERTDHETYYLLSDLYNTDNPLICLKYYNSELMAIYKTFKLRSPKERMNIFAISSSLKMYEDLNSFFSGKLDMIYANIKHIFKDTDMSKVRISHYVNINNIFKIMFNNGKELIYSRGHILLAN